LLAVFLGLYSFFLDRFLLATYHIIGVLPTVLTVPTHSTSILQENKIKFLAMIIPPHLQVSSIIQLIASDVDIKLLDFPQPSFQISYANK